MNAPYRPLPGDRGADAAARRPPSLLLGADIHHRAAWWLDPVRALLFIVLPIFCFAANLAKYNYRAFGASEDFVTHQTFLLGLYSAGMLIFGIVLGQLAVRRRDMVSVIDTDRATRVLVRLGWVTIIAYAVLFGTLVTHLELVIALFQGSAAAGSDLRDALGRIPGLTSLAQFNVIYLALLSALVSLAGYRMSPQVRIMSIAIFGLTLARSILASERLAMLEALAASFVIPIAFRWKPSPWRASAPFLGIVGVFIAFAAGEYFRSWQYYRAFYDSYFDFIIQRFAGYFSTSINNGAGAYLLYGRITPTPQITVGWIDKFPILKNFFLHQDQSMLDQFLNTYASPEFNNPGGFYAAFLDFNFVIASIFMLVIGVATGVVYRSFSNKNLLGLILFPVIFLGTTDYIRIVYITDTRTLPILLGALITYWGIRPRQMPRQHFLAQTA